MNNYPIGIFDSGIGGLTVAYAIKEKLPNEDIIYFGDTKHLPYGEKSSEAIQTFCKRIVHFLVSKNCKAIVIACNSASAAAFNIVEKEARGLSVFNVIDPVIKEVIEICSDYNIGVIGTKATIQSNVYEHKIKELCNSAKVSSLATPLLAPMIEEGFINEEISHTVIASYLANKRLSDIDHLILACTHYPLIYNEIDDYYKSSINVIDSSQIVAKHIADSLKSKSLLNNTLKAKHQFYVSNYTKSFEKSAKFFFKEDVRLQEITLLD